MKTFFGCLICIFLVSASHAQNDAITKYFDKYSEDERFTVVYVSPKMFQMVAKIASEEMGEDIVDVVRDLKGLRILTTKENTAQFYGEAIDLVDTREYEVLMTVRDKSENVRFWTKESNDIIHELLLLVGGDDEFVLVSFVGDIDLDKIARIAHKLDIDGAEHLKKLKKKKGDNSQDN